MNDQLYKSVKASPVGIQYGLMIAGINIIWALLGYLMGVQESAGTVNVLLSTAVFILSLVLFVQGMRKVKRMQNGFITFGKAFKVGAIISIVFSIVYCIYNYLYFAFLDNQLLQKMKDQQLDALTEEQVESLQSMYDTMFTPMVVSSLSFVMFLIGGLILSAIIAAVIRQNPPETLA